MSDFCLVRGERLKRGGCLPLAKACAMIDMTCLILTPSHNLNMEIK
jgi:hypothetical protein